MELDAEKRRDLARKLKNDIDKYAIETYSEPFRTRLGVADIGHECEAFLWFKFRWCVAVYHTGRMQRLFQRGNREESWFIELLRGAGCKVELGGALSMCDGHFGGKWDAEVYLPESYEIPIKFLGEFKTQATGHGFTKLGNNGVAETKPLHDAQLHCYGTAADGTPYALYLAVNKNDDDLHIEIVPVDANYAELLSDKANRVIFSDKTPEKIALNASYVACKTCDFKDVCHSGDIPAKNCRSCVEAKPVADGQWLCQRYGQEIPKTFIPNGCDEWSPIINTDI